MSPQYCAFPVVDINTAVISRERERFRVGFAMAVPFWLTKTWPLVAICSTPLALTSAVHEPLLFATGTGLTLLLSRLTYEHPPSGTAFSTADEKTALDAVTITSGGNRLVRVAHGLCFLLAAFRFTHRWAVSTATAEEKVPTENRAAALGRSVLGWAGTVLLCYIGAKMFSTGYHGQ